MSERTIQERKCDECGIVKQSSSAIYGPPPFLGWVTVSISGDSRLNFCSTDHAAKYLTKRGDKK